MYTSLSNYLNNSVCKPIDANINESIFDIFSKNGKEKEAKGFFGIIGSIFSAITGEDDEITKALKAQEAKAEANAKKREDDLAKAAEKTLIAKMNADFEQKENQLTLANQQKINAYKAQEKQLKDEAGFWRNNKRQYTAEQLEGFNRTREELYGNLGTINDEGIVELNRLTTLITTDENGNTLSIEEIKQKAKDNSEFKALLEKYEKLANKYKKPMIEGAKTEDFYKQLGKTYAAATEISRAETALTNAKALASDYEKISKQVSTFNEKVTAHDKAQKELDAATSAVENFGNQYVTTDANGKVVAKKDANFRGMLTPLEGTNLSDETALNEYIDKLKNMGVPESVVTTIQNAAANPGESGDVANSIKTAINGLTDDQISEVSENVIQHQQTKYDELKTKKSEAEANVTNNPKPSKDDPEFADIKDMTDEQLIEYDVTTGAGKQTQKSIEDGLKEAETQVKKIQKDRETRAAKRKAENEEYQAMQRRKIPDEFKDEVNKAKSGLDVGETKVDGKPGIRVPKLDKNGNPLKKEDGTIDYEFIPKPDPNASDEVQKEYDKKKDRLVLNTKLGDVSGESIEYRDGKYYYKDNSGGETQEIELDPNNPSDRSEITRIYAEQQIRAEQRALILGKKQDLADKLSKCIKDGDLDPAVYKTMSNAEKEALRDIVSGKVSVDDMFAGVDLAGSSVKDSVNNFKKQHKDLVTAENGEDGNGKDKGSFEEYMKDLDDEAEDKGFDGDADHDDEDNVEDDEKGLLNDDGDLETDEDEEYTDDEGNTQTRKKKLKNPAKIWRRKKKKNGKGTTSSYYNKEGDSISKKEFKKRMATYKEALKKKKDKQTSTTTNTTKPADPQPRGLGDSIIDYTNLSNWLFEKLLNNI